MLAACPRTTRLFSHALQTNLLLQGPQARKVSRPHPRARRRQDHCAHVHLSALRYHLDAQGESMTNAESEWMDAICELGCIVCRQFGKTFSPAEPHHLLSGGRRIGHLQTIPLCDRHHRSGVNNAGWVSRHPWRTEFVLRYGSEEFLLAKTKELVEAMKVSA